MTIVRWEPLRELGALQTEMNRLFNTAFESPGGNGGTLRRWVPAMDVLETSGHFLLRLDLPGVTQDAVSIELDDQTLTISGERSVEQETSKDGYQRVERASGAFHRSLTLPAGIDPEGITAGFENGVLEVRIPKPEERKPRRIEIGGGEPKTLEADAV
jgi:HSP20 family protein